MLSILIMLALTASCRRLLIEAYRSPLRTQSSRFSLSSIHTLNGFTFEEVEVFVDKLNSSVVILEASSRTQELLVDRALICYKGAVEEDPYGSVLWPAAKTVSNRLCELDLTNSTVLELGTGTGLVSLVAAIVGAKRVLATDYNPLTLEMVQLTIPLQRYRSIPKGVIETRLFDVKDSSQPLPETDLLVIADLLYDKELGIAVAKRILEAKRRGLSVIVGDSPNRMGRPFMLEELRRHGIDCEFQFVDGTTVSGYRNSLISSTPSKVMPISMGLLEL